MSHPKFEKYPSKDNDARSRWFHYCRRHQIPYIVVEYRTSLADVEFDYITYDKERTDNLLHENEQLIRKASFEIFNKYKGARGCDISAAGWGVIRINNLPIDSAEKVALEIYELVTSILEPVSA